MWDDNNFALKSAYDVVIVGAGPAGAAAAKALAGAGLDCVIIEKCALKRDKMCSGIILPSAWKIIDQQYGPIPDHVYTTPREVRGCRYVRTDDPDGRVMTYPALDLSETDPDPATGANVERAEFDYWLCEVSGVPMAGNCLFLGYEIDGGTIWVSLKNNGRHVKISTKYLIGADGPVSRVRRSLAPNFDETVNWISLYEEQYEGRIDLESGWMHWILDRECFGSLLNKGSHIHVNIATPDRTATKSIYRRIMRFLAERHGFVLHKTTLTRGIVMNDMPYRDNVILGDGNVLLVGEAAGFVRALDGITSALVTGKAAGEAILASAEGGTPHQHYARHPELLAEREACREAHPELGKRGFFG